MTKLLSAMYLVAINMLLRWFCTSRNVIRWHAIHAWWRKTSLLDMVPKRPDTMAIWWSL